MPVRYLLYREETKGLDRFVNFGTDELSRLLKLAQIWNITEEQRLTIEYHELGITPPHGFQSQPINDFPTPGRVIRDLPDGAKRMMLERLLTFVSFDETAYDRKHSFHWRPSSHAH